jgi:DNA-directed RNA polymerase subunit H
MTESCTQLSNLPQDLPKLFLYPQLFDDSLLRESEALPLETETIFSLGCKKAKMENLELVPLEVYTNIHRMLANRKLVVPSDADLASQFSQKARMGRYDFSATSAEGKVVVIGSYVQAPGSAPLTTRIRDRFAEIVKGIRRNPDVTRVILVMPYEENAAKIKIPRLTDILDGALPTPPPKLELFADTFFAIDKQSHCKVPKHELMTKEEVVEEIVKKERIDPARCRQIRTNDPMARYIGAVEGDVVRITDFRFGQQIRYLYCVHENVVRLRETTDAADVPEDVEEAYEEPADADDDDYVGDE